jgi:hypothetical protein
LDLLQNSGYSNEPEVVEEEEEIIINEVVE